MIEEQSFNQLPLNFAINKTKHKNCLNINLRKKKLSLTLVPYIYPCNMPLIYVNSIGYLLLV